MQNEYIGSGKPWQNGSNECFNDTFRNECLNAEIFGSLIEPVVTIRQTAELLRSGVSEFRKRSGRTRIGFIPRYRIYGSNNFIMSTEFSSCITERTI